MKLTIPGIPLSKLRPRFSRHGKFVTTYDVQGKDIKRVQNFVIRELRQQLNSEDKQIALAASEIAQNSCFTVNLWFYMPIPITAKNRDQKQKLWGLQKPNIRPDLSNLIKFYEDCLNGILYHDDSQIVVINAKKLYSLTPRTEIEIMALKTFTFDDTNRVIEHFSPTELYKLYLDLAYLLDSMTILTDEDEDYEFVLVDLEEKEFPQKMLEFAKKYSKVITKIGKVKLKNCEESCHSSKEKPLNQKKGSAKI